MGQLRHGGQRLFHRRECLRRAELHRLLTLELDRVDSHHTASAGHRGALHGVDTDAADADHDHRVTGSDGGPVRCRAPAGGDAARDERHRFERQVGVDLDHLIRRNTRVLREGTKFREEHRVGTAVGEMVPAGAVGDHALEERATARITQVLTTRRAIATLATRRHERCRHVVTDGDAGDTRAHLDDHTRTFVATDRREHGCRRLPRRHHVAGDQVLIAVAQAGGLPFDDHLTDLRSVDLDLLDLPFLMRPVKDCCLALHVDPQSNSLLHLGSDPRCNSFRM